KAREMRIEVPHAQAGSLPLVASPLRFSATPVENYSAPPELGEHTDKVLGDLLGMDEAEIQRLRADRIIG
ncbi:MAG: hypothetical protein RLY97_966, partial [Pseudomonadota bacterium]